MSKVKPVFKEREEENKDKIWCDAFMEHYGDAVMYEKYSMADTLRIDRASICSEYQMPMSYVLQFNSGGFWLSDGIMYIATSGINSDEDATYSDAVEFIESWIKSWIERNSSESM